MRIRIQSPLALLFLLILVLFKIAGTFYPSARLWGVNQMAYHSWTINLITITVICLLVASIGLKDSDFMKSIGRSIRKYFKKIPPLLRILAGAGFSIYVFYILKDSTNLLGDGLLRLNELENFHYVPPTEPLDFYIHHILYDYLFKPLGIASIECYRWPSYIAGFLYIWLAWLLSKKLKTAGIETWLTFFYLLGWGGMMVFFGYVENYAFALVMLLAFFYFSIEYINSSKKLLPVIFTFLLAFAMHNLVICFLPSLVYMFIIKFKKNWFDSFAAALVILLSIGSWMVLTYGGKEGSAFLLPASISDPGYLVWSKAHLVDILNELVLISPAFIVLIWLQQISLKANQHIRIFFCLSAVSGLTLLLFLDPKLGMARDWDLYTIPLIGFHIALFLGVNWEKVGNIVKGGIVAISIVFSLSWILLNNSDAKSIERFKNIADLDIARARFGYEQLALFFRKNDRWGEAEETYKKSIEIEPHPRTHLNLGNIQITNKNYDEAEKNLKKAIELEAQFPIAKKNLAILYIKKKQLDSASVYLNQYLKTPSGMVDREAWQNQVILNKMMSTESK